jgi:hypothetical protein
MNYGDSPFRQLSSKPCSQCGRVHSRWAHCTTDALHLFAERMKVSSTWADDKERDAIQRYGWQHRQ